MKHFPFLVLEKTGKENRGSTLRKEFALVVVFIRPIMKDITIRMSPVKKLTRRTTFCMDGNSDKHESIS